MPKMLDNWTRDWSDKVTINFKRLKTDAKLPAYAHDGDAGLDVYLPCTYAPLNPGEIRIVPLGFAVEIPNGYAIQVCSRSGLASRGIFVINAPGIVDSNFRNEVGVILINVSAAIQPLNLGDRVCQFVVAKVPKVEWNIVDELSTSDRQGGFGSTKGYSDVI